MAENEEPQLEKQAIAKEKNVARLAELAEKEEFKDRKSSAGKMAGKIAPSIRNLSGRLASPDIQHVLAFLKDDAKTIFAECSGIYDECNEKLRQEKPDAISKDFAAVAEMCKNAATATTDVNDFNALIGKNRNSGGE